MELEAAARNFRATMEGYGAWWGAAGGWAIDLYLGRKTREHEDLEIVALRRDASPLYDQLRFRKPSCIHPGDTVRFEPWRGDPFDTNVIQLRLAARTGQPDFDVLLTPAEGELWICRRDETMREPLDRAVRATALGVPVLAPEIVLLFKAKRVEGKDESDFRNVLPSLEDAGREWLRSSLYRLYPDHRWLQQL